MRLRWRQIMEEQGMTLYQLAKAVVPYGVSEQAIYRMARSEDMKRLDMRVFSALLHVFNVEIDEILVTNDTPEPPPKKRKRKRAT